MLSRKSKDKSIHKDGVVGKYVKRDTPPEIPSEYQLAAEAAQTLLVVIEWVKWGNCEGVCLLN